MRFRLEAKRSAAGVRPAFACRAACQELAAFWRACVRVCVRVCICVRARVCAGGRGGGRRTCASAAACAHGRPTEAATAATAEALADWSHQLRPTAGGRRRARCSETLGLDKWKTQRYLERIEAGYPSNPYPNPPSHTSPSCRLPSRCHARYHTAVSVHTACTHHVGVPRYAIRGTGTGPATPRAHSPARSTRRVQRTGRFGASVEHFAFCRFIRSSVDCERHKHSLPEAQHSECTVLSVLT